jgi:hypothetical protein
MIWLILITEGYARCLNLIAYEHILKLETKIGCEVKKGMLLDR